MSIKNYPPIDEVVNILELSFQKLERQSKRRNSIRSLLLNIRIRTLRLSIRNSLILNRRITALYTKEIFTNGHVTQKFIDSFFHHMDLMKEKNNKEEFINMEEILRNLSSR